MFLWSEKYLKKYYRSEIQSCLIGLFNLSYGGILAVEIYIYQGKWLSKYLPDGPGGIFFLIYLLISFLIIPFIGNGVGFLLGVISISEIDCKISFAFLGILMNLVIPVIILSGLIFVLYFSL